MLSAALILSIAVAADVAPERRVHVTLLGSTGNLVRTNLTLLSRSLFDFSAKVNENENSPFSNCDVPRFACQTTQHSHQSIVLLDECATSAGTAGTKIKKSTPFYIFLSPFHIFFYLLIMCNAFTNTDRRTYTPIHIVQWQCICTHASIVRTCKLSNDTLPKLLCFAVPTPHTPHRMA